jgi:hypothetical protein
MSTVTLIPIAIGMFQGLMVEMLKQVQHDGYLTRFRFYL